MNTYKYCPLSRSDCKGSECAWSLMSEVTGDEHQGLMAHYTCCIPFEVDPEDAQVIETEEM